VEPIRLPSNADDLSRCLSNLIEGFRAISGKLKQSPVAISFAFPGPADYPNGIIGDLQNFPSFKGGIALGPMLEEHFDLPIFINNDGDLYAYGEALAGYLPHINDKLAESGSPKRYRNLLGITLGTGFGGGLVMDGKLYIGDNSLGTEVWLLRNKLENKMNAEEGVSIRAAQRVYAQMTGIPLEESPSPKDIYEIGIGNKEGDREAAIEAYREMGEVLGDALANVITITDCIAVIGGGISGAKDLIVPAMLKEMEMDYKNYANEVYPRLVQKVFYLDQEDELRKFLRGENTVIKVPKSDREISYDPMARVGVGFSQIGTSKAISLGAYAYALNTLDK
jgi:glucokinase